MNKYVRDLLTLPSDAGVAWRHQGVRGVGVELRKRSLDRVLRRSRSLVVEQVLDAIPQVPLPIGIQVRIFSGPDWTPLAEIASPATIARFRRAAGMGRTCFVAWRGDHAVGYTWLSGAIDPNLEYYPLPLPSDAAYGWDLFVASRERGCGTGSALVAARLEHARTLGFRTMWRVVDVDNAASRRTLEKTAETGTRIVGDLVSLRLLGLRRATFRRRDVDEAASTEKP